MDEASFGKSWYLIIGPSGRFLGKAMSAEEEDLLDPRQVGGPKTERMSFSPTYGVIMETMLGQMPSGEVGVRKMTTLTTIGSFLDEVRVDIDLSGVALIKIDSLSAGDKADFAKLLRDLEDSLGPQRAERAGLVLPKTTSLGRQ